MMRQIPIAQWPPGLEREVAFLSISPEVISERTELVFDSSHDDLDYFRAAIIPLGNGSHLALQHYENAPVFGTTVVVDDLSVATFGEIAKLLQLRPADVSWVSPNGGQMFMKCLRPAAGRFRTAVRARRSVAAAGLIPKRTLAN